MRSRGTRASVLLALVLLVTGCVALPPAPQPPAGTATGGASMPANMASHGLLLLPSGPVEAPEAGPTPVPSVVDDSVVHIQLYLDPSCSHCGDFVETNASLLATLITDDVAAVEVHPIAILDASTGGASSRAVAAIAAAVDEDPAMAWALIVLLLPTIDAHPGGFPLERLVQAAEGVGLDEATIAAIETGEFEEFAALATEWATTNPIPGTDEMVTGTPTVLVDGERFTGAPTDGAAFEALVAAHR